MDYDQFNDDPEETGTENPLESSAYGLLEDLSTPRHIKSDIKQEKPSINNEEEIELQNIPE